MNRWSVRQLDRGLGEYASAWDALHARLFRDNPMLDSRYIDALLQHFGDGSERMCIFHTGGVPQAMCVLHPSSTGLWATFLPSQAQIGPALLNRPELVQALFQALPGVVGEIDFLCNDPAFGDLSNPDNRRRESRDHALTVDIDLTGTFKEYWASRSKNLIKNMSRYERRLQADGMDQRLERIDDTDALEAAVARYARLESSGWKGMQGTAVNMGDAQGAFYLDLMCRFASTSGACVYELWFGEHLAASRLVIVTNSTLVILKTAYAENLSQYAPGRQLLRHVIQDAFQRIPGGRIEFYTDADADMRSWSTGQRWIRHVSFYRYPIAGNIFMMMRAGRQALRFRRAPKAVEPAGRNAAGVEVYSHPDEFPKDVLSFFQSEELSSIEKTVTWYGNFVDTVYPNHGGVRFYVLRMNGRPVAALPILVEQGKMGKQVRSLSNYYSALYAPVIAQEVKADDLVPLITAICAAHAPVGSFRMAPMDPKARTYRRLLNAMRSAGLAPFQFYCFGNWYLSVKGDWASYLAGRPGKVRSTIKRMSKKFDADGGKLEIVQGGHALEEGIKAFEQVYAASWKVPEPYPDFVPGLIRACAEKGWLRLGLAWHESKPVAAQLWIVASGTASIYKVAYDEAYKVYAPGTLLTAMLMQHVLQTDGVAEVDYLIGDDPYKQTWMSDRRERWGLVAYNPRSLGGLLGLLVEIGGRAIRFVTTRRSR